MFDAGAIAFRLQMVGAEVFKKDAKGADEAVKALGESSEKTAKKVAPVGTEVDKAGKAAKGAKAPLEETGKSTKKLGEESEKAAPKVKKTAAELEALKKKSDDAARTVGMAALGIGAAIATMATVAVAKFADFDQAVSQVGAATMASSSDLEALSASAVQAGVDTVFTAKTAANAQTELAKAGVSVADILGGALTGSLALASAGELEVARAAEIAATTLTVFGLKGTEAMHVADLLAAGAGKAQGSVDHLALALEYVGPTFARLNIPLESTVGTLAMLAANGILGEKAGTGLRGVIQSLTAPVAKGAEEMKKYGINVFDSAGEFIGMEGAAGQLQKGLGGLDEQTRSAALGAIFGAESANVAGILYAQGAEGVQKWTDNVNDQGFAADQAAMKLDNLAGDVEMLGGSMDAALIKTGSVANDTLRDMVQVLTGLVDWYSGLDEGLQGTVLWLGVGTAAALLLGGTFLLAVPKIVAFRAALTTLNTTMKGTAIAGGVVGIAITAAVIILGAFGAASADAKATTDALRDSLDEQTGAYTANTRAIAAKKLQDSGAAETAAAMGVSLETLTDAVFGNKDAIAELAKAKDEFQANPFDPTTDVYALDRLGSSVSGLQDQVKDAPEEWRALKDATDDAAGEADAAAPSYATLDEAVDGVTTSVSDLANELAALNGTNLDAREAARQLEAAYDDFDASLKENGKTLDTTTEKGRANEAALDKIAEAALVAGEAIVNSGGSYEDYQKSLEGSRAELLKRIGDLGITGKAAEKLADDILRIPSKTEFAVYAKTAQAQADLDAFLARNRGRRISIGVSTSGTAVYTQPGGRNFEADGGMLDFYANGGIREHHVAQIAKAGTMRVWAEPETGGEAYIPLAGSKRGRSTAILADVASEFGYQLVPTGAQSFADGGRAGSGGQPGVRGGVNVDVTFVNPIVRNPVDDARTAGQFVAASLGLD